MEHINTTVFASDPDSIVSVTNAIVQLLPSNIRRRFNTIKLNILSQNGIEGLYSAFHGKTVGQILATYDNDDDIHTISEGEIDGLSYKLSERRSIPNESS